MKKKVLCYLLAIVGAVLLVGFFASCDDSLGGNSPGGNSPEPKFMIIESREYTKANEDAVGDALWDKYFKGKTPLNYPELIYGTYKNDIDAIMWEEINKKQPSVGLFMVIKVDQYRMFCQCHWNNNAGLEYLYWFF